MNYRGKWALALTLTLGLVTSPASADPYHHPLFAQSGQAAPRPAVGANLSLNIPLGGRPKRNADNAPVLEFRTGAHLTGTGRDFQVSPLLSYRWKPGGLDRIFRSRTDDRCKILARRNAQTSGR